MLKDNLYMKKALNWIKAIQRHELPGRLILQSPYMSSISSNKDLVKAGRLENGCKPCTY